MKTIKRDLIIIILASFILGLLFGYEISKDYFQGKGIFNFKWYLFAPIAIKLWIEANKVLVKIKSAP